MEWYPVSVGGTKLASVQFDDGIVEEHGSYFIIIRWISPQVTAGEKSRKFNCWVTKVIHSWCHLSIDRRVTALASDEPVEGPVLLDM